MRKVIKDKIDKSWKEFNGNIWPIQRDDEWYMSCKKTYKLNVTDKEIKEIGKYLDDKGKRKK